MLAVANLFPRTVMIESPHSLATAQPARATHMDQSIAAEAAPDGQFRTGEFSVSFSCSSGVSKYGGFAGSIGATIGAAMEGG